MTAAIVGARRPRRSTAGCRPPSSSSATTPRRDPQRARGDGRRNRRAAHGAGATPRGRTERPSQSKSPPGGQRTDVHRHQGRAPPDHRHGLLAAAALVHERSSPARPLSSLPEGRRLPRAVHATRSRSCSTTRSVPAWTSSRTATTSTTRTSAGTRGSATRSSAGPGSRATTPTTTRRRRARRVPPGLDPQRGVLRLALAAGRGQGRAERGDPARVREDLAPRPGAHAAGRCASGRSPPRGFRTSSTSRRARTTTDEQRELIWDMATRDEPASCASWPRPAAR